MQTSRTAATASTTRPTRASTTQAGPRETGDEQGRGGDQRQREVGECLEQRRQGDPGTRDIGRDRPLAVQDEPGGDVGRPGHGADDRARGQVRCDRVRPGEPGHEDAGRAGAGDVGDRAGGREQRQLPGRQRHERGANGVVVDQSRQHDHEHEPEETGEHERATHDRSTARRRLGPASRPGCSRSPLLVLRPASRENHEAATDRSLSSAGHRRRSHRSCQVSRGRARGARGSARGPHVSAPCSVSVPAPPRRSRDRPSPAGTWPGGSARSARRRTGRSPRGTPPASASATDSSRQRASRARTPGHGGTRTSWSLRTL